MYSTNSPPFKFPVSSDGYPYTYLPLSRYYPLPPNENGWANLAEASTTGQTPACTINRAECFDDNTEFEPAVGYSNGSCWINPHAEIAVRLVFRFVTADTYILSFQLSRRSSGLQGPPASLRSSLPEGSPRPHHTRMLLSHAYNISRSLYHPSFPSPTHRTLIIFLSA